jgi:hypothetical protein
MAFKNVNHSYDIALDRLSYRPMWPGGPGLNRHLDCHR